MNDRLPEVIHEASGVIAIRKPAGLATQAAPGIPSVESWLRQQLGRPTSGGYLGVPHRLDRAVSGVLLFAITPRAARQLSRQFERRQIRKTYLAIVRCADAAGEPGARLRRGIDEEADEQPDRGDQQVAAGAVLWRDMVEKVPDEARARVVPAATPGGREAVTVVRLRRQLSAEWLLLELAPLTGRMHQLRLQAAARGMPVVGDVLYGGVADPWQAAGTPASPTMAAADEQRSKPIALHAWRIEYADPDTGAAVMIEADLPDFWPAAAR